MSARTDMLLQNYLEQLLEGKVALRLLRTLLNYPGRIFTVRKLAEAADVSVSEAAVVVQQLETKGILKIQPVGRSYLISLNNRSYVVNRLLKPMLKAEEQTMQELVSLLGKCLIDKSIVSASVFGSVARGESREESDVDLFVISDDFERSSLTIARAQEEVASIFNARLSPLIMSRKELKGKAGSRLLTSILDSHRRVAGKDLKELIGHK